MTFEDIAPNHFEEWGGLPDVDAAGVCGFAARDDEGVLAALCCAFPALGRWWAAFGRNERASLRRGERVRLIRETGAALASLGAAGVREVWAELDETKLNAREFLEHLGFRPVNKTEWVLELIQHGAPGLRAL